MKKNMLLPAFIALGWACHPAAGDPGNVAAASSAGASSGSDRYYEYRIQSVSQGGARTGSTKMYISSNGKMRAEMLYHLGGPLDRKIVVIGDAAKPTKTISLDDSAKTWTVNHIDPEDMKSPLKTRSEVTKVGNESVAGYNTVHARIVKVTDMTFMKMVDTIDIWQSPDVPIPNPKVRGLMEKGMHMDALTGDSVAAEKLDALGCRGWMLKIVMHGKNIQMTQELVKTEARDLPASLFEVPAGYRQTKD